MRIVFKMLNNEIKKKTNLEFIYQLEGNLIK